MFLLWEDIDDFFHVLKSVIAYVLYNVSDSIILIQSEPLKVCIVVYKPRFLLSESQFLNNYLVDTFFFDFIFDVFFNLR